MKIINYHIVRWMRGAAYAVELEHSTYLMAFLPSGHGWRIRDYLNPDNLKALTDAGLPTDGDGYWIGRDRIVEDEVPVGDFVVPVIEKILTKPVFIAPKVKAGRLTLVETHGHGSVYTDSDGEEVWLGKDGRQLLSADDLWDRITDLWDASEQVRHRFLNSVPYNCYEPEQFTEHVDFCCDCGNPEHKGDLATAREGGVCESCLGDEDRWASCNGCSYYTRTWFTRVDVDGDEDGWICAACRDYSYRYCDNCDGYYHRDDDHYHERGCDCESPAREFVMRNVGGEPLREDTPHLVQIEAGLLSDEGERRIRRAIRTFAEAMDPWMREERAVKVNELSYSFHDIGRQWKVDNRTYTKRLSSYAYKNHALKVPPDLLTQVGNIFTEHSGGGEYEVEVTRDLNLSPAAFAHSGSCWWSDYATSRCALKSNGGFGLRSFTQVKTHKGDEIRTVTGRAWVMPVNLHDEGTMPVLRPTFNAENPDGYFVFNAYGNLQERTAPRVIAAMTGMSYKQINLGLQPMYINNGSGYLIGDESLLSRFAESSALFYELDQHADVFQQEQVATEKENAHV